MAEGVLKRKLDYSDLLRTPDDGKIYEIIDGALYVSPSPSPLHQRVSRRLQRQLEDYFHPRGLGEVFNAPLDVILARHDIVVADLIVVTDPARVSKRGIEGAPALAVEVLSPASRPRDQAVKKRRYADLGVSHYWIVDPDARWLECYELRGGAYQLIVRGAGDEVVIHPVWPDLELQLTQIWA